MRYVAPSAEAVAFTCPECGAFTQRIQTATAFDAGGPDPANPTRLIFISRCVLCNHSVSFLDGMMIFPDRSQAPAPHEKLPENVKKDYEEAASIASRSPRGAAALLRLAIQKLCMQLGGGGENLSADIGSLVKRGLPELIQQSLDVVRVTGNNAVHPGQIETDDPQVAETLFELTNIIVEQMIAVPERIKHLYDALPEVDKARIEKRDKPKQ